MRYVFPPQATPTLRLHDLDTVFPVHRIYCVGRNYAAHAREMGKDPDREPPFFFCKPADAIVPEGADVPYPTVTSDLHHEVELVVAIGTGGRDVDQTTALDHVFGYAVGVDLTRRDLQAEAKAMGRPWDTAKGFDHSAPVSLIRTVASLGGHPSQGSIWLSVNGDIRQSGDLSEMIWNVPETIAALSALFTLRPGDLIFTGTPAGVSALQRDDHVAAGVDGIGQFEFTIV